MAVSLVASLRGQENPQRKISYVLADHEKVFDHKYYVGKEPDQVSNMLIVHNLKTQEFNLIINSQIVFSHSYPFTLSAISFAPTLRYLIAVEDESLLYSQFMIYDENGAIDSCNEMEVVDVNQYTYQKDNDYYWGIDGVKHGPFSSQQASNEFYYHFLNKNIPSTFDSYIKGSYDSVSQVYSNYSYVKLNQDTLGPYDFVHNKFDITDHGEYYFLLEQDDGYYIQHNQSKIGPFNMGRWEIEIADNQHIIYYSRQGNNEHYVHIDDQKLGPFDKIHKCFIDDKGQYGFFYTQNDTNYVNINGQSETTFLDIKSIREIKGIDENGDLEVIVEENSEFFSHYHGHQLSFTPSFAEATRAIHLYSSDLQHEIKTAYQLEFVTIDGVQYGNGWPIRTWYDPNDNTFNWYAVEGKEVVIYIFQLPYN